MSLYNDFFLAFRVDLNKRKIIGKAVGDLVIDSMYNMSGRILIIPLDGHGRSHVDLRKRYFIFIVIDSQR